MRIMYDMKIDNEDPLIYLSLVFPAHAGMTRIK